MLGQHASRTADATLNPGTAPTDGWPRSNDSGREGPVGLVVLDDAYPRIRRYIAGLVRDPTEAEDLTQETFLRAYRGSDALRDPHAGLAWLYRIATHVCLDRLRQRARQPVTSDDVLEEMQPTDPGPAAPQLAEQDEMSACVQDHLVGLPDSYRAVLLLDGLQELTGPQIAELLGVSLATVKIRLHRARRALRSALEHGCEFSHDERDVLVCESRA